jgi:hypothetical protein
LSKEKTLLPVSGVKKIKKLGEFLYPDHKKKVELFSLEKKMGPSHIMHEEFFFF